MKRTGTGTTQLAEPTSEVVTHLLDGINHEDGTTTVKSVITLCCHRVILGMTGYGTVDPEACTCPGRKSSDSGSTS